MSSPYGGGGSVTSYGTGTRTENTGETGHALLVLYGGGAQQNSAAADARNRLRKLAAAFAARSTRRVVMRRILW